MKKLNRFLLPLFCCAVVSCYTMRGSKGGGEKTSGDNQQARNINTADIIVPDGYKIEVVAQGLTFPSAGCMDDKGNMYVIEAGYSYGEVWLEPRLLKIEDGKSTVICSGGNNGPWTGIVFHEGNFYVAEGGARNGGKILRISPDGKIVTLVENLPSIGDHHTNGPLIHNGYIYFGIGVATNSAVIGEDNKSFGWLDRNPTFHDIPCRDITLSGKNFLTDDVLNPDNKKKVETGAYVKFGESTSPGQVIKGEIPCTGSILRIPLAGGTPELVAWGLRNPYGFAKGTDGKLYVTENGADDRGSRPVWGSADVLWEIVDGAWYGWPDYSEGRPIEGVEDFHPPGKPRLEKVLAQDPAKPPVPVAIFGVHSSSNGIDFSTSDKFGFKGDAFVAQFGDMAPGVGKVQAPVGFKVVRVKLDTGIIEDFAINKGSHNGPATFLKNGGLERPLGVWFDRKNTALYITDFGIMNMSEKGPEPIQKTGVIWKISKI